MSTEHSEASRQRALDVYHVVDTFPEVAYDDIVTLASQLCGVPIALISLIDRDRQWFKSRHGLDVLETPRETAFCAHAILDHAVLQVADTLQDARFADNPLVTGDPRVRFYAGAPLAAADGSLVGTLCLIDQRARQLDDQQLSLLRDLADLVEAERVRPVDATERAETVPAA